MCSTGASTLAEPGEDEKTEPCGGIHEDKNMTRKAVIISPFEANID
jgi:hypothetical protein